jgi:hypothetical protein
VKRYPTSTDLLIIIAVAIVGIVANAVTWLGLLDICYLACPIVVGIAVRRGIVLSCLLVNVLITSGVFLLFPSPYPSDYWWLTVRAITLALLVSALVSPFRAK